MEELSPITELGGEEIREESCLTDNAMMIPVDYVACWCSVQQRYM